MKSCDILKQSEIKRGVLSHKGGYKAMFHCV